MQNQFSSSVLLNGDLHGIDGDTTSERTLKCMEFLTGEVKWTEMGFGSSSLMVAEGKLIILSEHGELIIAPADPHAFQPLARASVLS